MALDMVGDRVWGISMIVIMYYVCLQVDYMALDMVGDRVWGISDCDDVLCLFAGGLHGVGHGW